MTGNLLPAAALIAFSFLCNLPLGRWRAAVRKFSVPWFLAVHLSIPLIAFLRVKMGLGAWLIPFTLGAAVVGQLVGGAGGGRSKKQGRNTQAR
ncbi:MAG: hypothetical protein K6T29_08680 [Peptococcaceae bacterium]|nr:hypothetical protein [Peptococcaceae bacterium]